MLFIIHAVITAKIYYLLGKKAITYKTSKGKAFAIFSNINKS